MGELLGDRVMNLYKSSQKVCVFETTNLICEKQRRNEVNYGRKENEKSIT